MLREKPLLLNLGYVMHLTIAFEAQVEGVNGTMLRS